MADITYGDERAGRLAREAVTRKWNTAYAPTRHLDPMVVLVAVALSLFGLVFIYSATFHDLEQAGTDTMYFVNRQVVSLALGLVAMGVAAVFDYRVFRAWAPVLYVGSVLLLVLTLVMGETINGAKAWIVIGGFQFQPSELSKIAVILMLAALFAERREEALGLRALLEALAVAAAPMALILLQPDFGTFIVYVAIVFGVLLLARVRVRYMVALAAIGLLAIFGALQLDLLEDYQVARLTTFINPDEADPAAVYNVNQAQIAIGSGQFAGQGLFEGSQTSLAYVPENQTDFIFTVVGEELGFLGATLMLGLFGLLISRALRIAAISRDTFGTLVAGGIASVFAFQLFINVGMAVGIMPVTGLTLPFVSYGGTSLIASFAMIGLLLNIHMRRFT